MFRTFGYLRRYIKIFILCDTNILEVKGGGFRYLEELLSDILDPKLNPVRITPFANVDHAHNLETRWSVT